MRKILLALACSSALFAGVANAEAPRVSGEPAWGNEKAAVNNKVRDANYLDADTAQLRFSPIAKSRIDAVRARNSLAETKVLQVGIQRDTSLEGADQRQPVLLWKTLADGAQVARFAVTSPAAHALRVGLNFNNIPAGAELRFLGAADGDKAVAMTQSAEIKRLRREQPVYWTPVTEGEQQIIEIYLPSGTNVNLLRFTIDSVSHLIVSPYGKLNGAKACNISTGIDCADTCEIDTKCASQTTSFINAKNSVARMVFQSGSSSFLCTGTLLNDLDSRSQTPYFYGANHCISTQTEASTLTTFWFYESTSCGSGALSSSSTQVAGGATLLYNDPARDSLLLRLNNAPPSGAFFLGWDANPVAAGTSMTVIHHPAGDVKKVSLGQVKGFNNLDLGGSFINVGYTSASTEGGSSGSGLLTFENNEYFLRGGLQGGSASCSNFGNANNNGNDDFFSRFDQAYPSISQYLAANPDYTGAWFNANESGWGLSVIRGTSGGYGIIMYHYNQSSSPTWYFMSGGSFSGNTYSSPITLYSGPYFGGPFNPALVSSPAVGSVTINFTSATTATLSYTINGITVSNKSITKIIF